MKIMIEEWDGDGAIRIPDEALQELELDVGDAGKRPSYTALQLKP